MALAVIAKHSLKDCIWDRADVPFQLRSLAAVIRSKGLLTWNDAFRLVPETVLSEVEDIIKKFPGLFEINDYGFKWLGEDLSDADPNEIVILRFLQGISGYPYDYQKDLRQIREWGKDYPCLNLIEQLKAWRTWLVDNENTMKKKVNYRLRFSNWLKMAGKPFPVKVEIKNTTPISQGLSDLKKALSFD